MKLIVAHSEGSLVSINWMSQTQYFCQVPCLLDFSEVKLSNQKCHPFAKVRMIIQYYPSQLSTFNLISLALWQSNCHTPFCVDSHQNVGVDCVCQNIWPKMSSLLILKDHNLDLLPKLLHISGHIAIRFDIRVLHGSVRNVSFSSNAGFILIKHLWLVPDTMLLP